MRRFFLFVWMNFAYTLTQAQCNCSENFEYVYSKTKMNYAGWKDKTSVDLISFQKFTAQQRQKASAETNKNYCYRIIQDWLNYFKDHHTHLYDSKPPVNFDGKSEGEIRNYFQSLEKITISEKEAIQSINRSQNIEGIWEMIGGNYRVAIVKNKTANRDYAGVVLKADSVYWVPGQIKIELTDDGSGKFSVLFFMRDHSMRMTTGTLVQNELRFDGLSSFRKVYPTSVNQSTQQIETISYQTEFKKLNKSTLYFRLPTFNHQVKNIVDSLIQANHDLITETQNLILDVRDNGGGSDITYGELIQYLYTGKIELINNSIWSSEDNIQKFRNILDDPQYPESGKEYIRSLVKRLEANRNTFVRKDDNVIRRVRSLSQPRNVIILMNRGCASSCEEFILTARQSKKVTLMGENTMGVLDYANVHQLTLPCTEWGLQYATSRTNRLPDFPIDNIGIEPAVKIPEGKNWLEVTMDYLKRKN